MNTTGIGHEPDHARTKTDGVGFRLTATTFRGQDDVPAVRF